jgi:hypothetical protein
MRLFLTTFTTHFTTTSPQNTTRYHQHFPKEPQKTPIKRKKPPEPSGFFPIQNTINLVDDFELFTWPRARMHVQNDVLSSTSSPS